MSAGKAFRCPTAELADSQSAQGSRVFIYRFARVRPSLLGWPQWQPASPTLLALGDTVGDTVGHTVAAKPLPLADLCDALKAHR